MDQKSHSTIGEGILTGLVGGVVAAVWHLFVDLIQGQPFHTPSVLGQVLVGGDITPVRGVVTAAVAGYVVLHFVVFSLLGIALVGLTHMSSRNPALRMGVWLGLVISFLFSLGFFLALYWTTRERFPWMAAAGGSILGVASMGMFLWRRHPALRGTFEQAPLGAEVKAPPHPRSGSRR